MVSDQHVASMVETNRTESAGNPSRGVRSECGVQRPPGDAENLRDVFRGQPPRSGPAVHQAQRLPKQPVGIRALLRWRSAPLHGCVHLVAEKIAVAVCCRTSAEHPGTKRRGLRSAQDTRGCPLERCARDADQVCWEQRNEHLEWRIASYGVRKPGGVGSGFAHAQSDRNLTLPDRHRTPQHDRDFHQSGRWMRVDSGFGAEPEVRGCRIPADRDRTCGLLFDTPVHGTRSRPDLQRQKEPRGHIRPRAKPYGGRDSGGVESCCSGCKHEPVVALIAG